MEIEMMSIDPSRELIGYLVRHGELNIKHKWDGWGSFVLSDEGREQLEKTGQWLSFEKIGRIVASDLPRAAQSAEIIMTVCNVACPYIAFEPNLRSWAIGAFTAKEKTDERKEEFMKYVKDPSLVIPDGESHNQLEDRVKVMDQYLAAPYDGLLTVIVTHNSAIKARMGIDHPGDVVDPGGIVAVYLNERGEFEYEIMLGKTEFDIAYGAGCGILGPGRDDGTLFGNESRGITS
jgi:broad specificity phosphatase PhoE